MASFVVARGELEASPRGEDDLHLLLADRLAKRLGAEVAIGAFASGSISASGSGCVARLNRLPRGVSLAEARRLIVREFGDLGPIELEIGPGRMEGEADQTWIWDWQEGKPGKAVLVLEPGREPTLHSWSEGDAGAPVVHADACELLGVGGEDAVCLQIGKDGLCSGPFMPGSDEARPVADLLPRLDPRLRMDDGWTFG